MTHSPAPSSSATPLVAVVGAGAIAARFHLPALLRRLSAQSLVLVDKDLLRARALGEQLGISRVSDDLTAILPEVSGVVLATPHHLHYPMARVSLDAGVPVLSEKPLSETGAQAKELAIESQARGVAVAVNNTWRFYPVYQAFRGLIQNGELGKLQEIDVAQGDQFDWPCSPGSYFGRYGGGRGVFLDLGAHAVDLVCWWLGEKPSLLSFLHDAMGGTEAYGEMTAEGRSVRVQVRLSWLTRLANRAILKFEGGSVEAQSYETSEYLVRRPGRPAERRRAERWSPDAAADAVTANFLAVLSGEASPTVSAADVLPSLELIDECYARGERRPMPWYDHMHRYADA